MEVTSQPKEGYMATTTHTARTITNEAGLNNAQVYILQALGASEIVVQDGTFFKPENLSPEAAKVFSLLGIGEFVLNQAFIELGYDLARVECLLHETLEAMKIAASKAKPETPESHLRLQNLLEPYLSKPEAKKVTKALKRSNERNLEIVLPQKSFESLGIDPQTQFELFNITLNIAMIVHTVYPDAKVNIIIIGSINANFTPDENTFVTEMDFKELAEVSHFKPVTTEDHAAVQVLREIGIGTTESEINQGINILINLALTAGLSTVITLPHRWIGQNSGRGLGRISRYLSKVSGHEVAIVPEPGATKTKVEFKREEIAQTHQPIEAIHLPQEAQELLKKYEQDVLIPQPLDLGHATEIPKLYPGERTPFALRGYEVKYPPNLWQAYIIACELYDKVFMSCVHESKTWPTDYQFAPYTLAFQVDGPAYSDAFIELAATLPPEILAQFVIARAFEFENNIAMYGLNSRLWPYGTTNQTWHMMLDTVRAKTGKKVAVLAGSEDKLSEMIVSELGIVKGPVTPEITKSITGFDAYIDPDTLSEQLQRYNGADCDYVLYGRTSMPKSWLADPSSKVEMSKWQDPSLVQFARKFALTHNFDLSSTHLTDSHLLTDTKEAMVRIGAVYPVSQISDIYSQEFINIARANGISFNSLAVAGIQKLAAILKIFNSNLILAQPFQAYLRGRGMEPEMVAKGEIELRAKPLRLHYGAYGHIIGKANRANFLLSLLKNLESRGPYIVQPEFSNLIVIDIDTELSYIAIDRIFLVRDENGQLAPMESVRSLMPTASIDGRRNTVHEGPSTRCARIVNF